MRAGMKWGDDIPIGGTLGILLGTWASSRFWRISQLGSPVHWYGTCVNGLLNYAPENCRQDGFGYDFDSLRTCGARIERPQACVTGMHKVYAAC